MVEPNNPPTQPQSPIEFLKSLAVYTDGTFNKNGNGKLDGIVYASSYINKAKPLEKSKPVKPAGFNLNDFMIPDNSSQIPQSNKREKFESGLLQLNQNMYIKQLGKNGGKINIDVGSNNVTLYVDTITGNPQTEITINGSGTLNLVVLNSYNTKGSLVTSGDGTINIYYYGSSSLELKAGSSDDPIKNRFTASIFVKNPNVTTTINGGNITGGVYSFNSVTLSGNSEINKNNQGNYDDTNNDDVPENTEASVMYYNEYENTNSSDLFNEKSLNEK